MENYEEKFYKACNSASFTGDQAIENVLHLMGRVGPKRLSVVTRLLNGIYKLGGRVEFCSDVDGDTLFEGSATGLFCEDDQWIYLRTDHFKSWKSLEQTLAHEAVHLLQHFLFKGERDNKGGNMTIYLDRCWAFDGTEYHKWLEEMSDEETPIYEVEAYSEMSRPRGVACALEYSYSNPSLWQGTYYCSLQM